MDWLKIVLGVAAVLAATVAGGIVVHKKINERRLREYIKKEFAEAVKARINDKSTKRVDVGIFAEDDCKIKDLTFTSEEGVSDELYVGQEIYL